MSGSAQMQMTDSQVNANKETFELLEFHFHNFIVSDNYASLSKETRDALVSKYVEIRDIFLYAK